MDNDKILRIAFAAACGITAFSFSYMLLGLLLKPELIKGTIQKVIEWGE